MEFKIDKGVPIPPPLVMYGGRPARPWRGCDPGDSFFQPADDAEIVKLHRSLAAGARTRQRRQGEKWIARRVVENGVLGVRVWRIG